MPLLISSSRPVNSVVNPTGTPVDPGLYGRLDRVASEARAAFVLSPVYWSDARIHGVEAARLGAELLSSLTGPAHDFAEQGMASLDKANATWGTTAKEPYWNASGLLRQAAEALLGYHQG